MKMIAVLIVCLAGAIPLSAQDAGWIGVTVEDGAARGARIRAVDPDGPAAAAGLQAGDVILEYNGETVAGVLQLTRLVRETPVGRTVSIRYERGGNEQTVQVTTARARGFFRGPGRLPDLSGLSDQLRNLPSVRIITSVSEAGLDLQSLTPQLRQFFGVSGNSGVLVTSVQPGSPAEAAGLLAGDVIVAAGGTEVSNPMQFRNAIRSSGSPTTLRVVRDKQERNITLETRR